MQNYIKKNDQGRIYVNKGSDIPVESRSSTFAYTSFNTTTTVVENGQTKQLHLDFVFKIIYLSGLSTFIDAKGNSSLTTTFKSFDSYYGNDEYDNNAEFDEYLCPDRKEYYDIMKSTCLQQANVQDEDAQITISIKLEKHEIAYQTYEELDKEVQRTVKTVMPVKDVKNKQSANTKPVEQLSLF